MKFIKILFGSLAALWALGCLIEMLTKILSNTGGAFLASQLLGGVAGTLLGSAISIACFKSAFKKPESE